MWVLFAGLLTCKFICGYGKCCCTVLWWVIVFYNSVGDFLLKCFPLFVVWNCFVVVVVLVSWLHLEGFVYLLFLSCGLVLVGLLWFGILFGLGYGCVDIMYVINSVDCAVF